MGFDLTACAANFSTYNYSNNNNQTWTYKVPQYAYNGSIKGILGQIYFRILLITLEGCRTLCGEGSQYYPWSDISNTITTWVPPVIGLILQAPFESNENFNSFLALSRWIGNPIASISYVLWNIKVIGKCAMMVDMATPYDKFPGEDSQFAGMRDSLYILSVMNQYEVRRDLVEKEESIIAAEKLLRIALFSDELPMTSEASLTDKRKKLAGTIRVFRKKGVIPVFVSTLWFLFALAISIESSFGNIGTDQAANNLALGLLLAFLPIFILSCIVDRNAVAAGRICVKLNRLLASVRSALLDDRLRHTYGQQIYADPDFFNWINDLRHEKFDEFFTDFAGQGRIRWHYGVAHPLLCSFEDSFMAEHGRGWLSKHNANEARTKMRDHRDKDHRLIWFDPRMIRQIASSICVVCTSAGGAFILSYYTPTVGLGCRSGGYVIYVVITMFLFLVEMLCWGLRTSYVYLEHRRWMLWISNHTPPDPILMLLHHFGLTLNSANTGNFTKAGRTQVKRMLEWWENSRWTGLVDALLRVIEVGNSIWRVCIFRAFSPKLVRLVPGLKGSWDLFHPKFDPERNILTPNSFRLAYIISAQTFGSYRTCDCISSVWAGGGRYSDFEQNLPNDYYLKNGIALYWGAGTGLSCSVLIVALAYIVAEFCTQSHLATEDFGNASEGIRFTRRFKKYTYWFRQLLGLCDKVLLLIWKAVRFPWQRGTGQQSTAFNKTLVWDWKEKPKSADGTRNQRVNDQARRRLSNQFLMEELQDERSSRNSQSPERSEGEGPENQTHYSEQHDTQDETHIQVTSLQLPTPINSRYTHSQPPSPSSEASLSSRPVSH